MSKLIKYVERLQDEGFNGSLELDFEDGKIVYSRLIRINEVILDINGAVLDD